VITTLQRRPGVLDRVVDATGSVRAVGLMRILFGVIVIRHLLPDLAAERVPVERFHVPWWSWLPVPSRASYQVLLLVGVLAGAAMILGLACRAATALAFAVVTYLLVVDMTGFAHNRGFLVWILAILTLLPTDRALALDSRLRERSDEILLWPVMLLRILVSSVYLVSGGTKLLDADWRSGLVLWDRTNRMEHLIPFDGFPHDILVSRWFHSLLAPSAIAVELFVGIGLWRRRTRLLAIWVAIVFHGSIELTASVQTFSYSAIAALLIWVTPRTRDRVVIGGSRSFRRSVQRLDWLARFRFEDGIGDGTSVRVVDRDGRTLTGRLATLVVLSRLPLLFPIVAPALGLVRIARVTRRQ
jgi:hypothetical protein